MFEASVEIQTYFVREAKGRVASVCAGTCSHRELLPGAVWSSPRGCDPPGVTRAGTAPGPRPCRLNLYLARSKCLFSEIPALFNFQGYPLFGHGCFNTRSHH